MTNKQNIAELQRKIAELNGDIKRLTTNCNKFAQQASDLEQLLQADGQERSALLKYEAVRERCRELEEENASLNQATAQTVALVGGLIGAMDTRLKAGVKTRHINLNKEDVNGIISGYEIKTKTTEMGYELTYEARTK